MNDQKQRRYFFGQFLDGLMTGDEERCEKLVEGLNDSDLFSISKHAMTLATLAIAEMSRRDREALRSERQEQKGA